MNEVVCDSEICLFCGGCVGTCPENVISLFHRVEIDRDRCLLGMGADCGICILACPVGALSEVG